MLGVMTVRKDELRFREFDRYRGYYCGLCRAIGKRCGSVCRMAHHRGAIHGRHKESTLKP